MAPTRPLASCHVAIIGGGITGLAAAFRVIELQPEIRLTLFEKSPSLGGAIQTEQRDGFLVEHGPDMFTTAEPWGVELCRRLGMEADLIGVNADHRRAFVVRRGRLVRVPEGFMLMAPARVWPLVTTPLLSLRGKVRLLGEYFIPPATQDGDESLASFATRRLGREAYERLVQPLIGGIFTADPEKLSMAAALPQFVEMERRHGGVAKAVRRGAFAQTDRADSGARYNRFVAPRGGMGELVAKLAARLPPETVRRNVSVEFLARGEGGRWRLALREGETMQEATFDGVIVAVPAYVGAKLLRSVDDVLADRLDGIEYAGVAIAVLAYRREQIAHPLDGFGCVAPLVERRNLLSVSFSSVKFSGRAPEGHALLRAFVGGACQPHLAELSDDDTTALAQTELRELLGVRGEPEWSRVVRWRRSMPQYHVGHLERVAEIEQRVAPLDGLALAGNAYRGVGIPYCIRSGEAAAERVVASLSQPRN